MALTSTIRDHLKTSNALDLHPFFFAVEEGSPFIFTTPGVTTIPSDFRPTGFTSALVKPLLKVGHGIDVIKEVAARRSGVADTQEITLSLGPDEDDFLLGFFAEQPSDLVQSRLADTLDWADVTIYVDDVTDFSASGTVNLGKEAITYAAKDAPTDSLTGCTRGALGTVANRYDPEDGLYKNPVIVRDRIINHEGKVWHLYMGMLTPDGEVLDTIEPQEIFAGPCASNPTSEDWVVWSFRVRDYTALLDTELGGFEVKGELLNSGLFSQLPAEQKAQHKWGWIEAGVNDRIRMTVTADLSIDTDGDTTLDADEHIDISIDEVIDPGFYEDLPAAVQEIVNTAFALEVYTDVDGVFLHFYRPLKDGDTPLDTEAAHWQIQVHVPTSESYTVSSGGYWWLEWWIDTADSASVWPMFGFTGGDASGGMKYRSSSDCWGLVDASELPTFYKYGANSFQLPVVLNTDQYAQISQVLPSSGFLTIGGTEVVAYSSYITDTAAVPFDDLYLFTISEHSALGSNEYSYSLHWGDDEGGVALTSTQESEVKVLWGVDGDNVFDLLLKLLISTGGNRYPAGDYSTWDTSELPEYFSTPLPGTYLDTVAFTGQADSFNDTSLARSLAFSQPQNLRELIESQLVLLGRCLVPMPLSDGTYKLSLVDTSNLLTQTILDLTSDGNGGFSYAVDTVANALTLVGDTPDRKPSVTHDLNSLYNRAVVQPLYSVAAEEQLDWTWTYTEEDSRLEYGVLRSIEFAPAGLGSTPSVGEEICGALVAPLIVRWSKRIPLWTFYTDRRGWLYSPGDQVALTCPGIPDGTGSRGITDRVMTILSVDKHYFAPGLNYPCKVTAMSTIEGNFSMYAPSATVTAKGSDAGGDYITLAQNGYSVDGLLDNVFGVLGSEYRDILFFLGAGSVTLYRKGQYSAAETLEVDVVDEVNNRIYITSTPATDCTQGDAVVTFADWDDLDLSDVQRQWAYIGDLVDGVAVTSDPFTWS